MSSRLLYEYSHCIHPFFRKLSSAYLPAVVKCRNVQFLNTFPALPATTAADHAHIIDVGVTGNSYAMLQDAIVTLLYKICPATLTSFLSPNIKSSKLLVKYKESGVNSPFIIMKRSNKVLVGLSS
jgi:hypothetical protein